MKFSTFTRLFTLLLAVAFSVLCALFIPNFASYLCGVIDAAIGGDTLFILLCVIGVLLCLPCLAVLLIALRLSSAVEHDTVFTVATSDIFACLSTIMLVDFTALLCGVIFLFVIGEFTVSPLLAIADLVGFAIAVMLRVLSEYIRRAAVLKEEADATL